MNIEKTLFILKPDAIQKNIIGKIYDRLESNGLKIIASKMIYIDKYTASKFYMIHKNKDFYINLINFISSGPSIVGILEGENAILKNRKIIGFADPKKASPGTIRHDFAENIDSNIIHGSDSIKNAKEEIRFFFSKTEIYSRIE